MYVHPVVFSFQQPIILAEDTQPPVLHRTASGHFVDHQGHTIDLTKFGLNVSTVTTVPETQDDNDDDLLDDIPVTQDDDDGSVVPTQISIPATPLVSCTPARNSTQEVPAVATGNSTGRDTSVIEISSGESNAKKRKLMSRETECDFFEDHLVELLDAGNE